MQSQPTQIGNGSISGSGSGSGGGGGKNRPVLFHSSHCPYSKKVMNFIAQNDMTSSFTLFSVDTHRNQIPRFVRSVPTMLLPDMRMLVDEAVWEYIKRLADVRKAKKQQVAEVSPFQLGGGFGGCFENLEGMPCDDIESEGTFVRFDACPSITGLSSGDPSKPLSDEQIMAGQRAATGFASGMTAGGTHSSIDAFKRARDEAVSGGPSQNGPFMGGSISGMA